MAGPDDEYESDLETEELAFADEDERLPWLESGEYDEDEDKVDTGRILGFVLLGLVALGILVGAVYWLSHRGRDTAVVADGSTIAAPPGPYKQRPDNPGGKEFEGTGNLAPAVGEGETREGRIANGSETPQPSVDARKAGEVPKPSEARGVAVQVGAYSNRDDAESGWQKLMSQTDKLSGVSHRVVEGKADIGTVFRLQAMAGDAAAARSLCSALKSDGVACQVK